MAPDTGWKTVEHFKPKDLHPGLAYDWDNYRLVCGLLNSRKRVNETILDPFEIEDGWFLLHFPSLQVYKVGNGATTSTATITPSPLSTQPPFSCGTGTGCTGYYYPLGTTVTLTVSPLPSNFGGFTSNCTPIAGNPVMSCTVILNGNQAVGAIFN